MNVNSQAYNDTSNYDFKSYLFKFIQIHEICIPSQVFTKMPRI